MNIKTVLLVHLSSFFYIYGRILYDNFIFHTVWMNKNPRQSKLFSLPPVQQILFGTGQSNKQNFFTVFRQMAELESKKRHKYSRCDRTFTKLVYFIIIKLEWLISLVLWYPESDVNLGKQLLIDVHQGSLLKFKKRCFSFDSVRFCEFKSTKFNTFNFFESSFSAL